MMMMMMTRSRYPGHESLWMQRRLLCWAARQAQLTSQLPSGATAVSRAAEQAYAEARGAAAAAAAVSRSCACIGSPCLRYCGHGASIGGARGECAGAARGEAPGRPRTALRSLAAAVLRAG
jgi:hypothetical protein